MSFRLTLVGIAVIAVAGVTVGTSPAKRPVTHAVATPPGLYVFDASTQGLRLLIPGVDERVDVSWSPDGKWIASMNTTEFLVDVVSPTGGKVRDFGSVLWSPDGSRVAYSTRKGLFVGPSNWSAARNVRREGEALDWTSDGARFIFGTNYSGCCPESLAVARADGTGVRSLWKPPSDGPAASWIDDAAWSPTGHRIALYATVNNGVARRKGGEFTYLIDPSRRGATRLSIQPAGTFRAWSGDGTWLVLDGSGDRLLRVSPKGGTAQSLCPAGCEEATLSPDRRRVAFETTQPVTTLWVTNIDGSGTQMIGELPGHTYIDWSPDGRKLGLTIVEKDEIHSIIAVADLGTGQIQKLTDGSTTDEVWGGLSSDGSLLAFVRGARGDSPELWVVSAKGDDAHKVMTLASDPDLGPCPQIAWSPTTPLLAIADEACEPS